MSNRILKKFRRCFPLLFILIISCSEEPGDPINGVDGINGFNALVNVQDEPPGENCSTGGVRISVGQDENSNGTLDESETSSVSFICNGTSGSDGESGANAFGLVAKTLPENPGTNCENGGTLVQIGTDLNDNNTLDDSEVQTSFFVCNGEDGTDGENGLTSIIRATSSTTCENGGITIDIGVDVNENIELDADEINSSYDICNGADGENGANGLSTLSNVITEPSGTNCTNGGLKIQLGLDTNENGLLDAEEVVSENYVCNGPDGSDGSNGADGISSITKVTIEEAGDNCANGGLKLEIGMDDVTTDGELQDEEVEYTYFVCNGEDGTGGGSDGVDGLTSLVKTTSEDPGANCANGGIKIEVGLDTDGNSSLDAGEIMNTFYVCNGTDGVDGTNGSDGADGIDGRDLIVVTDTDVTCPNGGVEFTFGYDDDDDGTIDEVLETALICNGTNGTDGADGTDGLNSIVRSITEDPGANCLSGGQLVEVGLDDNRDNILQAREVDVFFYICNGQDGTDGADGSNGRNSLISVSNEPIGPNCTDGGLRIDTGIDDDGDGTLDAIEIDATAYVCDGSDGSDGSDGADGNSDNIFEFYFQEEFDGYTGVRDASITDKNPAETGDTLSVDRGSTDSHGLIHFPELDKLSELVGGQEFAVVEAILYLKGYSGRVDGQADGNWIGVKTLRRNAPLFEEGAVTWTRANSADENWAIGGVTSQNQDGNANGYSDMFQLPGTRNFAFDGFIPLKLNISEVTAWTDRTTGKDDNKGLVLLMADVGIQYELDILTSSYKEDVSLRPLLYLKVKTGVTRGRNAQDTFDKKWNAMSYEEKLAPLHRRKR